MKITRELLERYGLGLCSEEEKKAIKRWFETLDDPSLSLTTDQTPEFDREYTWSKMSQALPELQNRISVRKAKNIILLNKVARFAAAACLFIGTFFLGYFASPNAQADTVKKNKYFTDMLYVYGGDGAYAKLDGSRYLIRFAGRLRLYNDANQPKQIVCGKQEFTLEPHRTYNLSGSVEEATLSDNSEFPDFYIGNSELEGGFSMLRLYD